MTNESWEDLVNAAAEAVKPIPAGDYKLRVTEAVWSPSKAGNPMMALSYDVASGPQEGKKVRHWIALGERDFQLVQFVSGFKAHGVTSPDLNGDASLLEAQFLGKVVLATLEHDGEYEGQPNVRVVSLRSAAENLEPPPLGQAPTAAGEGVTEPPPMPAV